MLTIPCPYCGPREETEFTYGAPSHVQRPPFEASDGEWTKYLYHRDNLKGPYRERWLHSYGCARWFNILRDTTVPDDIGFGKPAAAKQSHYVGKRSLTLTENVRPDRPQLVGLSGEDSATAIPVGSHVRLPAGAETTDGWVTSAGFLSTNGQPVALAMIHAGRSKLGELVTVHDDGQIATRARLVNPLFYDPTGARMHA